MVISIASVASFVSFVELLGRVVAEDACALIDAVRAFAVGSVHPSGASSLR